jgi:chorismate synthase
MTVPRPGHADLAGGQKFGFSDLRNVLERASARETAARVAAGGLARRLLSEFRIEVFSHVLSIGAAKASLKKMDWEEIHSKAEASVLRCADASAEEKMKAAIDQARQEGNSLGGVFQVVSLRVPPGLGSYSQWDRRLDGRLAAALMSIPAVKGVEIGLGFKASALPGSKVHDEIILESEGGIARASNNAGGLEGGITNGEPIVLQAAMKPIPTLRQPLRSVNLKTRRPAPAAKERADVCAAPAAGVVAEAMCCLVLAEALLEKFGADTLEEMKTAFKAYRRRIGLKEQE